MQQQQQYKEQLTVMLRVHLFLSDGLLGRNVLEERGALSHLHVIGNLYLAASEELYSCSAESFLSCNPVTNN